MISHFRILLLLAVAIATGANAQHLNRINKHGERKGKWITYYDDAEKQPCFKGRFRNGTLRGKATYWLSDGCLERREVYRFRKIRTRFYYCSGKLRKEGQARIEVKPDTVTYFFYGDWKTYNEQGQLLQTERYEKGVRVHTTYNPKLFRINDSLRDALQRIDREFTDLNTSLRDSIHTSDKIPAKRQAFEQELDTKNNAVFNGLIRYIRAHGYPSKKAVGDAAIVPFFVLSYAPVAIREQCLPYFTTAADLGDIEWKSLAYFIDKLKVAKGEKQVYGTQSYYDKNEVLIYYPIENPDGLQKRRQEAGFEN